MPAPPPKILPVCMCVACTRARGKFKLALTQSGVVPQGHVDFLCGTLDHFLRGLRHVVNAEVASARENLCVELMEVEGWDQVLAVALLVYLDTLQVNRPLVELATKVSILVDQAFRAHQPEEGAN